MSSDESQSLETRLEHVSQQMPIDGPWAILHPPQGAQLAQLGKLPPIIITPSAKISEFYRAQGLETAPDIARADHLKGCNAALLCLPRSKSEAQMLIAAIARTECREIWVDGPKTHGVDSMLKALRKLSRVSCVNPKAHGKIFRVEHAETLCDWASGPELHKEGFWTAPGVFSADGVDPGSALLVSTLPQILNGTVIDLGAGWGYLSAHILARGASRVDLVEDHALALACAEHNITDERAEFHWADALAWNATEKADFVVMNPPFHSSRKADLDLGRRFIQKAALCLKPGGTLWMVANRHLPYEDVLGQCFEKWSERNGDTRFKVLSAQRPKRKLTRLSS